MMPMLVFDLETIPDVEGLRTLHQWSAEMSDAEVVERARNDRIAAVGHDFLPLYLQKIVAIGCVFRHDQTFQVKCIGSADDSEQQLMKGFFGTIEKYTPQLISWNGSSFDLPVLHYRSLIQKVAAPRYWDQGADDRDFKFNNYINRYHQRHLDLMDVLAKYNARANAPMDDLAKLCGFPGKLGMDGSQVWEAWTSGRQAEVRSYCETDVVNTWLLYSRYALISGLWTPDYYQQELSLVRNTLEQSSESHWKEYCQQWVM